MLSGCATEGFHPDLCSAVYRWSQRNGELVSCSVGRVLGIRDKQDRVGIRGFVAVFK